MADNKMDERQIKLLDNSLATAAIFAYIYVIILIFFKLSKTGDIKSVYVELGLIFSMVIMLFSFYITNDISDKSIEKAKDRKLFRKMDERQKALWNKSLAGSGVVAIFYEIVVIFIKLLRTKSIESAYTDIGLLVIMSLIITIYSIKKKEYEVPKTFTGKIISTGNSKEEKRARCKYYLLDAITLSIIFFGIDIISKGSIILFSKTFQSKTLAYGSNIIARILFFFTINYFWGEYNVKKYNDYYDSLIDED